MKQLRKIWVCVGLCMFVGHWAEGAGGLAQGVLARFDGGEITSAEYVDYVNSTSRTKTLKDMNEAEREDYLKKLILTAELLVEGRERGLWTPEWEAKRRKNLAETRLSHQLDEIRVRDHVGAGIAEASVEAYYQAHQEEFSGIPSYDFRHIFFNTVDIYIDTENPEEQKRRVDRKRAAAEAALALIKSGSPFVAVARSYSEAGDRKKVEDLGSLRTAAERNNEICVKDRPLGDSLQAAIRSLQPGETSDIFDTRHGYMIVRLESRTEGGVRPFSEVAEEISKRLLKEEQQDRRSELDAEIADWVSVETHLAVLEESEQPGDTPVAELAGKDGSRETITLGDYNSAIEQMSERRAGKLREDQASRAAFVRNTMVRSRMAYMFAVHLGLDKAPELMKEIESRLREEKVGRAFRNRMNEAMDADAASEEDLREFYDRPMAAGWFQVPPEVRARGFAVGSWVTPEMGPPAKRVASRFAENSARQLISRLRAGEEFEEIAQPYLGGASPEQPDGEAQRVLRFSERIEGFSVPEGPLGAKLVRVLDETGWLTRDGLSELGFSDRGDASRVLDLKVGDLTDPPMEYRKGSAWDLGANIGYLVLECLERREERRKTFDEARDDVEDAYKWNRQKTFGQEFLMETLSSLEYELNDKEWEELH